MCEIFGVVMANSLAFNKELYHIYMQKSTCIFLQKNPLTARRAVWYNNDNTTRKEAADVEKSADPALRYP